MISNKRAVRLGMGFINNDPPGVFPYGCSVKVNNQVEQTEQGVELIVLGPSVPSRPKNTLLCRLFVYNDETVEMSDDRRVNVFDQIWKEMMAIQPVVDTQEERLERLSTALTNLDKKLGYMIEHYVQEVVDTPPIHFHAKLSIVGKFDKPREVKIVLVRNVTERKRLNRKLTDPQRESIIVWHLLAQYPTERMQRDLEHMLDKMRERWGC